MRRLRLSLILTLLMVALLSGCASPAQLRPFTTDGCSLFPDRSATSGKDWCSCCVAHDRAYWRGGTADERLKADEALRACVLAKTGDVSLAALMYRGVRLGGLPYWPTPFRWAYGWGYGRFYQPLDDEEQARADRLEASYERDLASTCPCPAR
jgi:hypothetical protein